MNTHQDPASTGAPAVPGAEQRIGAGGAATGGAPVACVYIVDDDAGVRAALTKLCDLHQFQGRGCATGEEFLACFDPHGPACVVLDMRLPGRSGLELLNEIRQRGWRAPVIILTGHGDVPLAVQSLRAGALDFFEKPVAPALLLARVREAVRLDAERLAGERQVEKLRMRLQRLTPREREIMDQLALGRTCKQIAADLGLSTKTVQVHQRNVLLKMESDTVAELVRQVVAHALATARPAGPDATAAPTSR